jgi:AcrR family transcriptional regulator
MELKENLMPKAAWTQDKINNTKEKILDVALKLIIEEGFNKLSMRKIASRLGITAANIYNYYSSKDEINLMIRVRGFEMLFSLLSKEYRKKTALQNRIKALVWAYVNFGITYPGYYDLMFNLHTPKYIDYMGTVLEPVAAFEKATAMKNFHLIAGIIKELIGARDNHEALIRDINIQLWSDLHGIISLFNSHVLAEVDENSKEALQRRVNNLIEQLTTVKHTFRMI